VRVLQSRLLHKLGDGMVFFTWEYNGNQVISLMSHVKDGIGEKSDLRKDFAQIERSSADSDVFQT
jgi:hypothetical protein